MISTEYSGLATTPSIVLHHSACAPDVESNAPAECSSDTAQVYDGTAFLQDHPGGAESILLASGMDSSEDFNAIHSAKAKKMLDDYYIGDLDDSAPSKISVCSPLLPSSMECLQSARKQNSFLQRKFLLAFSCTVCQQ